MVEKRKKGRPVNPDKLKIQKAICHMIATSNHSLITVLRKLAKEMDHVPVLSTVWLWLDTDKEFSDEYARSKELQCEYLAEELIEIADDDSLDTAFTEEGKPFINKEHIQRSRVRIDTRKWILSKLKPKKYGEKLDVEHSVSELNMASIIAFAKQLSGQKGEGKDTGVGKKS